MAPQVTEFVFPVNPLGVNPTLFNANKKSLIKSIKDAHQTLIAALPATLVLRAFQEHNLSNASFQIGTSGSTNSAAETASYTADQWAQIINDLNLAQSVKAGYGLALTDSFGKLNHLYQDKKVFTMNEDGTTMVWTFTDPENQSGPTKSTVTDKKFIDFFRSMKTLSTSFPSLPDDQQFNHKVLDLGEELGLMIITIHKVRLNDHSEIGCVAKYSGFKPFRY